MFTSMQWPFHLCVWVFFNIKIRMRSRLTVSKCLIWSHATHILNYCTVRVHCWFSRFVHHTTHSHSNSSVHEVFFFFWISKWIRRMHTQKPYIVHEYWDTDQPNPKCAWMFVWAKQTVKMERTLSTRLYNKSHVIKHARETKCAFFNLQDLTIEVNEKRIEQHTYFMLFLL